MAIIDKRHPTDKIKVTMTWAIRQWFTSALWVMKDCVDIYVPNTSIIMCSIVNGDCFKRYGEAHQPHLSL
jgi:hypothetical protein